MPFMVALGGLLEIDSGLATLSHERVVKYSAQTQEVIDATRFGEDDFHRYTSRLVSAARTVRTSGPRVARLVLLRPAASSAVYNEERPPNASITGTWGEERSKVLFATLVSAGRDRTFPTCTIPTVG